MAQVAIFCDSVIAQSQRSLSASCTTGCFINCCAVIGNCSDSFLAATTAREAQHHEKHHHCCTQCCITRNLSFPAVQPTRSGRLQPLPDKGTWQSSDTSLRAGSAFTEGARKAFTRKAENRSYIRRTTRAAPAVPCWDCEGGEASPRSHLMPAVRPVGLGAGQRSLPF